MQRLEVSDAVRTL